VKFSLLTLTNDTAPRATEPVRLPRMGAGPPRAGEHRIVVTAQRRETGALLARNAFNATSPAGWRSRLERATGDGDRRSARVPRAATARCVGRRRSRASRWPSRFGAGLDPVRGLQVHVHLPPGGHPRVRAAARQGDDEAHARG
jgi:hypothetical protein